MGWQSQTPSAGAGGTRPTVPCQDVPASTTHVLLPAMLSRPLGAAQSALLRGASLWAAGCGMHVNWPCGGVQLREMRVEGHGSPMSSIKCVLLLCRFRSCDSSAAIPERSPTPLYYPLLVRALRVALNSNLFRWPEGSHTAHCAASVQGSQQYYCCLCLLDTTYETERAETHTRIT